MWIVIPMNSERKRDRKAAKRLTKFLNDSGMYANSKQFVYSQHIIQLETELSISQKQAARYTGLSLSRFLDYEQGNSLNYIGYEDIIKKLELLKATSKEVNK